MFNPAFILCAWSSLDLNEHPGPSLVYDLKKPLDNNNNGDDCLILAAKLNIPKDQCVTVKRSEAGGGSPVRAMLDNIANKFFEDPVENLIEAIPESYGKVKRFVENNKKKHKTLESFLSPKNTLGLSEAIKSLSFEDCELCWRGIANYFHYSEDEISRFSAAVRRNGIYSPTQAMFSFLRQNQPDRKVLDVFELLKPDCQKIMAKYLIQIAFKWASTNF